MAYSSAVFYIDVENGSDAARSTLTGVVFSNPSSTTVLGTYAGHGLVTGAVIDVTGCTQAYANSAWKITYVSADTFTLDDALWASFTGADVTGNAVPRGGSSWTDAWKTIYYGGTAARIQPGDEMRLAKSPTPVSTTISGTFTNPPNTLDVAKAISASTNTTPIVVTSNAHGLATGDVVYIYDHATNLSANGTWIVTVSDANTYSLDGSVGIGNGSSGYGYKSNCKVIKMASALPMKTVDRCEVAWSPSGSSTVAKSTTVYREGDGSMSISKSSPSNSTLYAYSPVSGDFSAYQNLSFWIRPGTIITDDAKWSVWLCTNNDGTNPVDEFRIPALPEVGIWVPLTLAKQGGGNLSASVASIAIYSGTSAATLALTFFDNFIATKTNDINLQSLVGKSSSEVSDGEPWFPIRSISDDCKVITIESYSHGQSAPIHVNTRGGGYSGTAGSSTVYYRETSKGNKTSTALLNWVTSESGSAGSLIKLTGGYNTSSGLRDGDTWLEMWGGNNSYSSLNLTGRSYIEVDHINVVRANAGIVLNTCSDITIKNFATTGSYFGVSATGTNSNVEIEKLWQSSNCFAGIVCSGDSITVTDAPYLCNNDYGMQITDSCNTITATNVINHNSYCIYIDKNNNVVTVTNASHAGLHNIYFTNTSISTKLFILGYTDYAGGYGLHGAGINNRVYGGSSTGNVSGGVYGLDGKFYLHGFDPNDSTPYVIANVGVTASKFEDMGLYFTKYGNTADDHRCIVEGGTIIYQKTIYHTPSTGAWKLSPTNAARKIEYPLSVVLARVYCQSGKLVTVQCYACRDNAGITTTLFCRKLQLAGITEDKTDSMTAAAGTWDANQSNGEQLEITFTPTEAGVVEIEGHAYGGTAYNAYFSNMTITQAD